MKTILKSKIWPAAWQAFSVAFIHLGLPLLAWGMDDLSGFFTNPARIGFACLVAARALFNAWITFISPPEPPHEHHLELPKWHAYMFEMIFIVAAFGDRRNVTAWPENMPLRWVGLGIYLAAMLGSFWINLTWVNHLRQAGQKPLQNPVLLTSGPFRWIRYPSLLTLVFACLGFALAFRSQAGLVLMLALVAAVFHRASTLDRVFAEEYEEAWLQRSQASKQVFPFLF